VRSSGALASASSICCAMLSCESTPAIVTKSSQKQREIFKLVILNLWLLRYKKVELLQSKIKKKVGEVGAKNFV